MCTQYARHCSLHQHIPKSWTKKTYQVGTYKGNDQTRHRGFTCGWKGGGSSYHHLLKHCSSKTL